MSEQSKGVPTIRERLLRAAAIMRERGLCQDGRYTDDQGRVCSLRALEIAVDREYYDPGMPGSLFGDTVIACERIVQTSLASWSDTIARDAEEAARMFERAAEGVS